MFGLDFVTAPSITAMKAASVAFVCRYLSEVNDLTKIKLLTPAEAKADSEAGISIVSNFEWYGNRAAEGFNSGVADAKIADAQHKACGGPGERPIYFSVDFEATSTQMGMIADYFKGVASVIGLARTGAYGSYDVIKYLLDNDCITWAWQTYAWSGGRWDARADIQQYENGVSFDGHEVDYDRSMKPDFGQWMTERTTWMSTGQQTQAGNTWDATTAKPVAGNNHGGGIFATGETPPYSTGIAAAWQHEYMNGRNWGPPLTPEYPDVNWENKPITTQQFARGRCEWDGNPHWYGTPA